MSPSQCRVFGPQDHTSHYVGSEDSSCFYYEPIDLAPLADSLLPAGKGLVGRAARIEVNDKDDHLHQHSGATIVFIASGSGRFKTPDGDKPVRAGDWIYVPPDTPHLSIADPHTRMIEMVVYIGAKEDRQISHAAD